MLSRSDGQDHAARVGLRLGSHKDTRESLMIHWTMISEMYDIECALSCVLARCIDSILTCRHNHH